MKKIVRESLDYDDVLFVPKITNIKSRDDVDLKIREGFFKGRYPIFSAAMRGISGVALIKELSNLNAIGVLHRFDTLEKRIENIKQLKGYFWGISIGATNLDKEEIILQYAKEYGAQFALCDISNGYLLKVLEKPLSLIRKYFSGAMAGNCVTAEGIDSLYDLGATIIKAGIGGGRLCSTRNKTSIGCPQLTALEKCNEAKNRDSVMLLSDGGIKSGAEFIKSIVFGADGVVIGTLFARALSAENHGTIFSGMASKEIQEQWCPSTKSIEGLSIEISEQKKPLSEIVEEFCYNIKSGMTYLDCQHYSDLKNITDIVLCGKGTLKNL